MLLPIYFIGNTIANVVIVVEEQKRGALLVSRQGFICTYFFPKINSQKTNVKLLYSPYNTIVR